ncbi:hypothetical protein ACM64Y_06780 [Novispirillum sp. DQ9]
MEAALRTLADCLETQPADPATLHAILAFIDATRGLPAQALMDSLPPAMRQALPRCGYLRASQIPALQEKTVLSAPLADVLPAAAAGRPRLLVLSDNPGGRLYVEEHLGSACDIDAYTLSAVPAAGARGLQDGERAPPVLRDAGIEYYDRFDRAIATENWTVAADAVTAFFRAAAIDITQESRDILESALVMALADSLYVAARSAVAFYRILDQQAYDDVILVVESAGTSRLLAPFLRHLMARGRDPWILIAQPGVDIRRNIVKTLTSADYLGSPGRPVDDETWQTFREYFRVGGSKAGMVPLRPAEDGGAWGEPRFGILMSPNDPNYRVTGSAIARALAQEALVYCFLLRSSTVALHSLEHDLADLIAAKRIVLISMNERDFRSKLGPDLEVVEGIAAWFSREARSFMSFTYCGYDTYDLVAEALRSGLSRLFAFLGTVNSGVPHFLLQGRIDAIITVPGRAPVSRLLTLWAKSLGIPTMDVQAFFHSGHPRYMASVSDVFMMINREQIALYHERFFDEAQQVIPIGSIMIHQGVQRLARYDGEAERAAMGIQPQERLVVFATQHGLEDINVSSIDALLDSLKGHDDVRLVVKCHPRESPINMAMYASLVASHGAEDWVTVTPTGDIYQWIAAADLIITQFSNVGLEAAVCHKPVLALNLLGRRYPVDLAEMGICRGITTAAELAEVMHRFLCDDGFKDQLKQYSEGYRRKNPELWDGSPVARVVNKVREAVAQSRADESRRLAEARAGVDDLMRRLDAADVPDHEALCAHIAPVLSQVIWKDSTLVPSALRSRMEWLMSLYAHPAFLAIVEQNPAAFFDMLRTVAPPSSKAPYLSREPILHSPLMDLHPRGAFRDALDALLVEDGRRLEIVRLRAQRLLDSPAFHRPVIICGLPVAGSRQLAAALDAVGVFQHVDSLDHEWDYIRSINRILLPHGLSTAGASPFDGKAGSRWILRSEIALRLSAAGYLGYGPWGFKDVRAGLTAEAWLHAFPEARLVCITGELDDVPVFSSGIECFSAAPPTTDAESHSTLRQSYQARVRATMRGAARALEVTVQDLHTDPVKTIDRVIQALELDCNVLPIDIHHLNITTVSYMPDAVLAAANR